MEELNAVFSNSKRKVTYEDIQNLRYLEQVIQETWRLFPPIPLIGKKPTADIELGKHAVVKRCGRDFIYVFRELHITRWFHYWNYNNGRA